MTVRQVQGIVKIQASAMDDLDKQTEILSILTGKTPRELEGMSLTAYRDLYAKMRDLLTGFDKMPGMPVKYLNGFKIPYDVSSMDYGQWVTLMHFTGNGDTVGNMHLILASIVQPSKKIAGMRFTQKNNPEHHALYAEALLDAKVIEVYHSCLFFCQMFRNSLHAIRGYLTRELIAKGANPKQAYQTIWDSIKSMDGFIAQNKLLSLTA